MRVAGTQLHLAVETAASGQATIKIDTNAKTVAWLVTHTGLSGDAKAAHFHGPAAEGENAGVVIDLVGGGTTSPIAGTAQLDDAQLADLMAGKWYVNIHTEANGGGEIRGQVLPMMQ